MKKSIEECNCICHRNPGGVRHCMPCCTICPVCGKNIRIMHIQTHIERCRKENKDGKLEVRDSDDLILLQTLLGKVK